MVGQRAQDEPGGHGQRHGRRRQQEEHRHQHELRRHARARARLELDARDGGVGADEREPEQGGGVALAGRAIAMSVATSAKLRPSSSEAAKSRRFANACARRSRPSSTRRSASGRAAPRRAAQVEKEPGQHALVVSTAGRARSRARDAATSPEQGMAASAAGAEGVTHDHPLRRRHPCQPTACACWPARPGAGALAAPLTPALAACPTTQSFAAYGDTNSYTLTDNGSLESSGGWLFTGGATIVNGSDTLDVNAPKVKNDSHSLALPAGSTATTPPMCVGVLHPPLRFFAVNKGFLLSTLKVDAIYPDANGLLRTLRSAS